MKYSLPLSFPLYTTHLLNYTLVLQVCSFHYLVHSHIYISPE